MQSEFVRRERFALGRTTLDLGASEKVVQKEVLS